jgi:hypothetical protein
MLAKEKRRNAERRNKKRGMSKTCGYEVADEMKKLRSEWNGFGMQKPK